MSWTQNGTVSGSLKKNLNPVFSQFFPAVYYDFTPPAQAGISFWWRQAGYQENKHMKATNQISIGRRAFIKNVLRLLTAGGIIISGAILAARKGNETSGTQACGLDIPCKGCSKFTGCNRSRAQEIKSAVNKKGGSFAGS